MWSLKPLALIAVALLLHAWSQTGKAWPRREAGAPKSRVSAGREVYISEGCIHCHSQYVRPRTHDIVWWGPAVAEAELLRNQPPLIGNRRQGPDLLNVGNRRSPEWNRLHLRDPRTLVPHSRMPSYAYLFTADEARGEALLAYLATLGANSTEERFQIRRDWRPDTKTHAVPFAAAASLFQANCQMCHGASGAGNGPLAAHFANRPPRDLTKSQWQFIPPSESGPDRVLELARVVKFGVPGTSMPGHETLSDAEVLGLAGFVQTLQVCSPPL